jgi:ATP-binding cassette, subfamily C (CFTR/MRP), member 1
MSALDARTERAVFQALLAENGLLRQGGTTVLMITNLAHHLSLADEIVFVGADGAVKHYDSFDELRPDALETLDLAKGAGHGEDSSKTTAPPLPKRSGREMKLKTQREEVKKKEKERARRTGDLRCYVTYGASMGWMRAGLFLAIAIMFAALSRAACKCLPQELKTDVADCKHPPADIWLTKFTDNVTINRSLFIGVFFLFTITAVALSLLSFWSVQVLPC